MARKALDDYRATIPTVIKKCKCCGNDFETKFGTYCSNTCKSKDWKETKRLEKAKLLVCFYCGGPVTEKKKIKFCCEEHGNLFENAKRAGRKIAIKINAKTTIFTDKYDKIPEVVAKQRALINDMSMESIMRGPGGNGGAGGGSYVNISGRTIKGDIM